MPERRHGAPDSLSPGGQAELELEKWAAAWPVLVYISIGLHQFYPSNEILIIYIYNSNNNNTKILHTKIVGLKLIANQTLTLFSVLSCLLAEFLDFIYFRFITFIVRTPSNRESQQAPERLRYLHGKELRQEAG